MGDITKAVERLADSAARACSWSDLDGCGCDLVETTSEFGNRPVSKRECDDYQDTWYVPKEDGTGEMLTAYTDDADDHEYVIIVRPGDADYWETVDSGYPKDKPIVCDEQPERSNPFIPNILYDAVDPFSSQVVGYYEF